MIGSSAAKRPAGARRSTQRITRLRSCSTQPCPWVSETEFKRQLVADYVLWGNGLSIVARVNGEPRELYRADPRVSNIIQDMTTGEPTYSVAMTEGGTRDYSWRDVIHIRNTTLDGVRGLGLVNLGQEAVALCLLLEAYASGLFSRGARPGGVLEMPGRLTPDILTRLKASFSNPTRAGRTPAARSSLSRGRSSFRSN